MIRVLHVMGCADAGGISAVVLNYYRFIDRTKIHFDIALTVPEAGQNAHALQELGAEIFFLPLKSKGMKAFQQALAELLKKGQYDALHVHESETCYVALQVAQKLGIRCRIAHSHTCSPWEGWKGELRRLSGVLLNYPVSTHVIGCGQKAGERVFGKWNMRRPKALVLPNAVETERFAYNEQVRREARAELDVTDCFVIGMVGRLSEEKNNMYALDLMPRILQAIPNAVLVVAGNGPDEEKFRTKVKEMQLERYVRQLGRRSDVDRLYQAFDVYLLPSFTEGFPVAAVEAMSSGLPVLLSDAITRELAFGTAVTYLSLDEPDTWVQAVLRWVWDENRVQRQLEPAQNGLNIRSAACNLAHIYEMDLAAR